jgi:hypothetical protein
MSSEKNHARVLGMKSPPSNMILRCQNTQHPSLQLVKDKHNDLAYGTNPQPVGKRATTT